MLGACAFITGDGEGGGWLWLSSDSQRHSKPRRWGAALPAAGQPSREGFSPGRAGGRSSWTLLGLCLALPALP